MHFATIWEAISDAIPNDTALMCGAKQTSWGDYDRRASRLASVLKEHGLGEGSKAAIYAHNSNEYIEAQYAIFKIRGCPINVNYRYKAEELIYLLENSDSEAVFFQGCYAARIWEIRHRLPKVKLYVQINDGTEALLNEALDYENAIRDHDPMDRIERSADDIYMLYTGGTTGMPKGVMYSNGQFTNAMYAGVRALGLQPPRNIEQVTALITELKANGRAPISLSACPLMHGTGMWLGAMVPLLQGGSVVTIDKLGLDPHLIWDEVERRKITDIVIVGDAFARPLLDALNEAANDNDAYDLSSVRQIISSGVMWSTEVKQGLLEHHDMRLIDTMGSTEGGMGSSTSSRESTAQTAKFQLSPGTKVFDDDFNEVEPGSGKIGLLATSGLVPVGYYKDPEKSERTFKEIDGRRYSLPGDYATVESDGSITLLGRGSNCINTAGEKVYPEEVEEAVKKHPEVLDCLVVGLADERFGQRVVAVASTKDECALESQDLIDFTRAHLAGYKLPKQVFIVDDVRRAPNGKADYKWAKQIAESRHNEQADAQ